MEVAAADRQTPEDILVRGAKQLPCSSPTSVDIGPVGWLPLRRPAIQPEFEEMIVRGNVLRLFGNQFPSGILFYKVLKPPLSRGILLRECRAFVFN